MAEVAAPGSPAPQAQPASPAPATPAPQEPQGLDKVYKDFGIEETAQQFQQPQSSQPALAQPQAPKFDPFDPNFSQHIGNVANGVSSLHQQLQQTQTKLSNMERAMAARQTESDIKSAVSVLAEKAGIEPEIAEVAFESRARKDPKLLAIWNNRHKNPKALEAALPVLASEFQQRFSVRQDPQLVENQRAVRASQQQMATTQKTTEQNKWDNMSFEERRQETSRIRRMGG